MEEREPRDKDLKAFKPVCEGFVYLNQCLEAGKPVMGRREIRRNIKLIFGIDLDNDPADEPYSFAENK